MKKIGLLIMSSLLLCAYSFAQVTTLTFTAKDTNGFYICLDRVVINNLTKNWTETIYYPDTVLIMGASGIGDAETSSQFSLFCNVPNPFAGVSEFSIQLAEPQKVTLSVFDAEGRKITTTEKSLLPGEHAFRLLLSTPQTYLLHVRAGTEQASLTVINTGNAGTNRIEYLQSSRSPLKIFPSKTNKGQTDNPFDLEDEMEYVGYAIINDTEFESEHIQQLQLTSESFELLFAAYVTPTVVTTEISDITSTSATSGGDVTFDGNTLVTARGVCWSTNPNPTISDTYTSNGSGTGTFTSLLTGLSANTTYYVRAYATNSVGTAYGNAITFITFTLPTVTTSIISTITQTSAISGGTITFDGNTPVTARGVCWSTSPNPTISDSHTSDGSGTGIFISSLTPLIASTTYYVCAYATNSVGTAYGNSLNFTTLPPPCLPITDIDNNTYQVVQIGTQCWMKENLRVTQYANGTLIPLGDGTSDTEPYRYYPNNSFGNVAAYGYLYNWVATMGGSPSSTANPSGVQGICPTGWHVPSDAEWTQLTDYVSSQSAYLCNSNPSYIAKALASTTGWYSYSGTCYVGDNPSSNNATGFSAVPAGYYYEGADLFGNYAFLWSATEGSNSNAYIRYLSYDGPRVNRTNDTKDSGYSVRCLRD